MITEKQKEKMLECIRTYNFCKGVACDGCPLRDDEVDDHCAVDTLEREILEIRIEPEKKLCPTCGHELDKESSNE